MLHGQAAKTCTKPGRTLPQRLEYLILTAYVLFAATAAIVLATTAALNALVAAAVKMSAATAIK